MGNPVVHFEILGKGAPEMRSFYSDMFGWKIGPPVEGDIMSYTLVDTGQPNGLTGGLGEAPEGYDGHVTFYIGVTDIEAAFADIEKRGGTKMMGPDQVPNGPIIGLFKDPQGNRVGLVEIPA